MALQIPVLDAAPTTGCKFPNDLDKRLEKLQKEASSGDVTRFLVLPTIEEVKRKKRSARSECPADSIEDLPAGPLDDVWERSICPWKHVINTNHTR